MWNEGLVYRPLTMVVKGPDDGRKPRSFRIIDRHAMVILQLSVQKYLGKNDLPVILDTNSNENPRAPINYAGIVEVVCLPSGPLTIVKGPERGLYGHFYTWCPSTIIAGH